MEGENFSVNALSLTSWGLTRDRIGRITSKTETAEGITSNFDYTYDSVGRLLTVTKDGTLVEEYQYGPNGRRIYEMNVFKGIAGRTLTYSDEDHLLSVGDTTYQYDPDGFLTYKTNGTNVTSYLYSSSGELLSVTLPGGRLIEYVNDPLGRRIAKKIDGVITEKYLWQGLTRLLAVYDSSDNLVMRFEYADDRTPITMTNAGIAYYMTYDQVGSLRVVADASGNVVKAIDYDSFGNIINDTNPSFTVPFGFAGGLHDRDTGLVRFGFRDYNSEVGRWTAKDPMHFAGGDVDLYSYVANNPVNTIDPEGTGPILFRICVAVAAADAGWTIYEIDKYAKQQEEASKKVQEIAASCKTQEDLLNRWDEIEELRKQGLKAAQNLTKARIWGYVSGGAIVLFCAASMLPILP